MLKAAMFNKKESISLKILLACYWYVAYRSLHKNSLKNEDFLIIIF
jgi:hypothetical protein